MIVVGLHHVNSKGRLMEILLIDLGALALFLGFMAVVYWRGVAPPPQRRALAPTSGGCRMPTSSEPHGV